MNFSKLGNTDLEVSKICLGTMTFGVQNTESEAHDQLNYAIDQGINFIDTAEMYPVPPSGETKGRTEQYIGTWLKEKNNREKVIIATKASGPSKYFESYMTRGLTYTKENIKEALELSLKQLQTDYIDLYQLHWPERDNNRFGKRNYEHNPNDRWTENFINVIDILNDFKKEGKIRHYGLSNESPWGVMRFLNASDHLHFSRMQSIQNPYCLLNRTYEIGLSEISIRENIGLLAYSPLAHGYLSGKFHKGLDTPKDRINQFKRYNRFVNKKCYDAVALYLALAEKLNVSLTQLSLAFVNTRNFLTSNIIGATNMVQLKENIDSINFVLTQEMEEEINKIHELNPNPGP